MWQHLRATLERTSRSRAWRDAGCWALDAAERHLGSNWLTRHAVAGQPVPDMFIHPGSDLEALSHLLELSLRLELLQDAEGFGAVRRMLRRDLDAQAWRHPLIQLEVASLAHRAGIRCCLEHSHASQGRPADIVLGPGRSQVVAEVKVVLLDEAAAAGGREDHEISQVLNRLAFTYGVDFDGQMTVRLGEQQRSRWLARLEAAARFVASTGRPQNVTWGGEVTTVLHTGSAAGASFTGPVTRARGWERTRQLLADKAEQLAHHGGGWLRIDSLDGLFWASEWARKPLETQTLEMEALIIHAVQRYPSVHGMVLTSGACLASGMTGSSWRTPGGTYGLERPLPMGRGRATFIIPLGPGALGGIRRWHDLYNGESGWLDWALSQAGLPSVAQISG